MQENQKLNLGCGHDIREGWINLDSVALPGVDQVHDLNQFPYPFEDNAFKEINAQDIIEHVDDLTHTLKELHRILMPSGILTIRVPHYSSPNTFIDPTHQHVFSIRSFDFYIKNSHRAYYFDFSFSSKGDASIELFKKFFIFGKTLSFWIPWVEKWINAKERRQWQYEDTCFVSLLPASNIIVELIK